ncbi:hypothetical protein F383_04926 [Gossypium arboreum]|uniref:Uncharacterized protein n=1 Tax=Gossypium arboreum TaxID=29729 RepID=A0A0B0P025_GOSAR|nr:hypothetical protein F383_04926 [Gossypium arboreum]
MNSNSSNGLGNTYNITMKYSYFKYHYYTHSIQ